MAYWRHVIARFAVLWILGMVAQGRLLSMDIMLINPFNNTLQAIADVLRFRRGTWLVLLFGQTSLMAYMCHVFKPAFKAFGKMFAPGAAHLFGSAAEPIATWLAASVLLVCFLALWRDRKRS